MRNEFDSPLPQSMRDRLEFYDCVMRILNENGFYFGVYNEIVRPPEVRVGVVSWLGKNRSSLELDVSLRNDLMARNEEVNLRILRGRRKLTIYRLDVTSGPNVLSEYTILANDPTGVAFLHGLYAKLHGDEIETVTKWSPSKQTYSSKFYCCERIVQEESFH